MYLALLDKFEKEVIGEHISKQAHMARFDFALWLEKNAAQQSAQADALPCGHPATAIDPYDNSCLICVHEKRR